MDTQQTDRDDRFTWDEGDIVVIKKEDEVGLPQDLLDRIAQALKNDTELPFGWTVEDLKKLGIDVEPPEDQT